MRHIRCIKAEVRSLQDCGPYSRPIKRHPFVTVSCTCLPCRQTTGNHSLLFSKQTSVLLLSLPYTPLCTAERSAIPIFTQEHYLPITLSCQHLSSLFPLPDGEAAWSVNYSAQLICLSSAVSPSMWTCSMHRANYVCHYLLHSLLQYYVYMALVFPLILSQIFCLQLLPSFPTSPPLSPLQLGMQLPYQKPGKGKPCSLI